MFFLFVNTNTYFEKIRKIEEEQMRTMLLEKYNQHIKNFYELLNKTFLRFKNVLKEEINV